MVIDVAYFVDDEEIREKLLRNAEIRVESLKRCYDIEGYAELPLDQKNVIYDRIVKEVEKDFA